MAKKNGTVCRRQRKTKTVRTCGGAVNAVCYVYMLRCGDGSLYTGWTDNVEKRLAAHNSGQGAKYTRGRGPLTLVFVQELPNRGAALSRESAIKKLARSQKETLVLAYSTQAILNENNPTDPKEVK